MDFKALDFDEPMDIVASILFLLTQHALTPTSDLPPLVVEHLAFLEGHSSATVTPLLRQVCVQLRAQWNLITPRTAIAVGACCGLNSPAKFVLH